MERTAFGWQRNPVFEVGQQWVTVYDHCPWDTARLVLVYKIYKDGEVFFEDTHGNIVPLSGMRKGFPGSKFLLCRESQEKLKRRVGYNE